MAPPRGGLRDEAFSEVTGERAPSFRDLSLGETAALSHSTLLMALRKIEGPVEGNAESRFREAERRVVTEKTGPEPRNATKGFLPEHHD